MWKASYSSEDHMELGKHVNIVVCWIPNKIRFMGLNSHIHKEGTVDSFHSTCI